MKRRKICRKQPKTIDFVWALYKWLLENCLQEKLWDSAKAYRSSVVSTEYNEIDVFDRQKLWDSMEIGEALKILGINRSTGHDWINGRGLRQFFSPSATGADGGTQRILTEADILVLNTIRSCRAENMNWEEIATHLNTGHREQEFPLNAISTDTRTIPLQQAEQSARAMATVAERDAALAQVDELKTEIRQLQDRLAEELAAKEAMREALLREMGETRESLLREIGELQRQTGNEERLEKELADRNNQLTAFMKEIGELQRQIGKLEGQLEFYRQNNQGQGDKT